MAKTTNICHNFHNRKESQSDLQPVPTMSKPNASNTKPTPGVPPAALPATNTNKTKASPLVSPLAKNRKIPKPPVSATTTNEINFDDLSLMTVPKKAPAKKTMSMLISKITHPNPTNRSLTTLPKHDLTNSDQPAPPANPDTHTTNTTSNCRSQPNTTNWNANQAEFLDHLTANLSEEEGNLLATYLIKANHPTPLPRL